MNSLFLLLLISLATASAQVKNASRPTHTAANHADAPIVKQVALSDAATPPPAIAIIEAAAAGLSMQSETDAPFAVKFFASQQTELAPGDVAALAEQDASKTVEIVTVAAFFENAIAIEDWMSDDEKARARQFQRFVQTLNAQLENPQVYLFGERERSVIIIGKVKGGFGGVLTLVVET